MRITASRAFLRQNLARPEPGIAHDVIRSRLTANEPRYLRACRAPSQHVQLLASGSIRALHTTTPLYKAKASKEKKREDRKKYEGVGAAAPAPSSDADADPNGPKHPAADPDEPLDFADVASRLKGHDEHFREALKKLRTGGRFNPDSVGALRVQPDRKNPGETYPLREVAQIVPRGGRTISLIAHEEVYVKAILSAVQASPDFNQQPQRDADNALELVLKIEPERPDDLVRRVKAACNEWRDRVRAVRQRRDKIHTTWRRDGLVGPDLKRTADKELDKVIKAKMTEIDDAEKEALKVAEAK